MKKIQNLIRNKDLISTFKKSKFKNFLNKKKISYFFYLLTKFKKNIKVIYTYKIFCISTFIQKKKALKQTNKTKNLCFIKLSILLM